VKTDIQTHSLKFQRNLTFDVTLIISNAELEFNLTDCRQVFGNSLFLMGEIGGNDFNYLFFEQKSIAEIKTYVPYVVNAIASAIHVSLLYLKTFCSSTVTYVTTLIIQNISSPN